MLSFDLDDLELLDADRLGAAGDAYLAAHPEIPRDADGAPLRGMLVPYSAEERASWTASFNEPAPLSDYRGPSYDDLKKRGPGTYNEAERYWIAKTEGLVAEAQGLKREAELRRQRDLAEIDLRVSHAETDYERARRKLAEAPDFDPFGMLKKALPWVAGGALVIVVGSVVVPFVVPLLAARRHLS